MLFQRVDPQSSKTDLLVLPWGATQPALLQQASQPFELLRKWYDRAVLSNGYRPYPRLWISDGTKGGTVNLVDQVDLDVGMQPTGARHLFVQDRMDPQQLPLPSDPALTGIELAMQCLFLAPGQ